MPRVFVSHSTKDREIVERDILPVLQRVGIDYWYSTDDIKTAARWEQSILKGLESCEWFMVLMSSHAESSEWVKDEVLWAIDNRPDKVVPVLVHDKCNVRNISLRLARIQYVRLGDNKKLLECFQEEADTRKDEADSSIDEELRRLCLLVLEGDMKALAPLAERMTELGMDGDGVRGRRRLTRDAKRHITLMVLPDKAADRLSCTFVEHVLHIWESAFPKKKVPRIALESRKRWLNGEISDGELTNLLEEVHWFYKKTLLPLNNEIDVHAEKVKGTLFNDLMPDGNDIGALRRASVVASQALSVYGFGFSRPDDDSLPLCSLKRGAFGAKQIADCCIIAVGDKEQAKERDWQLEQIRIMLTSQRPT